MISRQLSPYWFLPFGLQNFKPAAFTQTILVNYIRAFIMDSWLRKSDFRLSTMEKSAGNSLESRFKNTVEWYYTTENIAMLLETTSEKKNHSLEQDFLVTGYLPPGIGNFSLANVCFTRKFGQLRGKVPSRVKITRLAVHEIELLA